MYTGFLRFFGSLLLLMGFLNTQAVAQQDSLAVIQGSSNNNSWLQFSDASHALYEHLTRQAYDLLDKRAEEVAQLHSRSDWEARQKKVKKKLMKMVGPFPKKTPLHATITKKVDKKGYRVENIVYQSQPGFYVTSSLFIPDGVEKTAPAIIYTSGHTKNAYRDPVYQHVILNLVKKGFIVFAFDPVGQGERLQYYDSKTGIQGSEHSYAGAQAFITGSSMARYFIWDGIRAVDYLRERKEVDQDRIGITGRSGGGTQSAYVAAIDERISAAAPENYITSFTRLLQSIGPQDAEQNLPGQVVAGIDHADLLEVRAPKPTVMLTTTRDIFSIQGARETAREVSRIYKAYGKPGRFDMVVDDAVHRSTKKNREAMYAFFQKYLNNPGSAKDEDVELLDSQELQVTRTGQVVTSLEAETVFSLNRRKANQQMNNLQNSRKNLGEHLPKIVKAAKKLSGYQKPKDINQPVFTGRFQKRGYSIEKYFVKGEGDYPIPYLLLVPSKPNGKAVIYLDPAGKSAHLRQQERLARRGVTVLAPDLLGIGENKGDYRKIEDTSFVPWFASILVGRSIVGIQASDVAHLTRLLHKRRNIKEVYGLARRQMGPVLLHSAAFDSSIARIALIKSYSSYRSIVMNRFYEPRFIPSSVAGALQAYDLPDLAASLAPRKMLVAGVTNGAGQTIGGESIIRDLEVIRAAYKQEKTNGEVTITTHPLANLDELLTDWLK